MKNKQTCSTCPHQLKCWAVKTNTGKPVSTQNIIINILICRLQLDINRNIAATNLIQIFRPGMIRLLSHVKQSGNTPGMSMDQLLTDMQSTMIEYLLYDYKIGDRGRATPYLFDPHQGFLTKWVKWIVGKNRRFYSHHEFHSGSSNSDGDTDEEYQDAESGGKSNSWMSILEGGSHCNDADNETTSMIQEVSDIIEDGVTLNSNEYRVIKFCMQHANESNSTRHIDGLHISLAKLMHVSRPRITRLYKRARDKLRKRYSNIYEDI